MFNKSVRGKKSRQALGQRLGMSRVAFSRVVNGKAAISPDLAIRLERAGAGTARGWLAMQTSYDLAQALKHEQPKVVALT